MVNIDFDKGILNKGDASRIINAMLKAQRGEEITVGFFGGSITQGCSPSVHEKCYAYLVYEWWKEKFPRAKVNYLNAGIGGTPSFLGVSRVDRDLLQYKPDFSIVEFSVNDESTLHYMETYEGLVRHILKDQCETGLMLVHNVRYDNMESAEDKHLIVGKYYELPCVSMKYTVYPLVANKTLANTDISVDDLHPNDLGHFYLSRLVINYLDMVFEKLSEYEAPSNISKELPASITVNGYEHSVRLQNYNSNPLAEGFVKDDAKQEVITDIFKYGYTAWKEGDSIIFNAKCSSIAVSYRKSVNKPAPIAIAIVDDDIENGVLLDSNFDEDWGDCLYTALIANHIENKEHKIEIRIIKDHSSDEIKDVVPFYLVSVNPSY